MSATSLAVEAAVKTGAVPPPSPSDNVLAGLTKYIPTESVTLYVGAVSAADALQSVASWLTPDFAYWFFVGFTPALLLLIYLRELAIAGKQWWEPNKWPYWRMIAATIAFAVWALAVPGNPIIAGDGAAAVASLGAVFVSTLLNLIAPLCERINPAMFSPPGNGH
jgi:hypothetical protein